MAIELRNPLTITEETKIYGHNTVDIDGVPTDAGNGNVGQIVDIVDTKYIQGIKTDIDNIKAKINGEIYRTQLVDANAYQIDVPSPVFPYAEVQKLKGKSVVWNQLIDTEANTDMSGWNVYSGNGVFENGTLKVTGATGRNGAKLNRKISIPAGHKIYMSFVYTSTVLFGCNPLNTFRINNLPATTVPTSISKIEESISNTNTNFDCFPATIGEIGDFTISKVKIIDLTQMFGAGNEPTLEECEKIFSADYYPFDAGTIKSFPVQTVKSVGKNLCLAKDVYKGADQYLLTTFDGRECVRFTSGISVKNKPILFKKNTRYTASFDLKMAEYISGGGSEIVFTFFYTDGTFSSTYALKTEYTNWKRVRYTSQENKTISSVGVYVNDYRTYCYVSNFQLEEGSVATEYSPYMESSLDLSSITTDMKSTGSVADEWQNGKVTKRVGVVDLGTLVWNYYSNLDVFWAKLPSRKASANGHRLLCNKYTSYDGIENLQNKGICVSWLAEDTDIAIKDTSFGTDTSAFKSAMLGVMLYYELATPTDETVPLTEQFIDIEAKGTLTFISDESVQMPIESTTKFVVNLEEV